MFASSGFSPRTPLNLCQPVLDVVIEERDLGWSDASHSLAACRFLPDASFNSGDDLAELNTGGPLVPASATLVPAVAVAPLVQEHGLPLAIRAEPQAKRQRAVSPYFAASVPVGRGTIRHRLPGCGYGTCASGPASCCPRPEGVDAPLGKRVLRVELIVPMRRAAVRGASTQPWARSSVVLESRRFGV